jgi:hypothetical protein
LSGRTALIYAALFALPEIATAAPHADVVGTYLLTERAEYFGGFSGLEFGSDGTRFIALSDSAALINGKVARDAQGAITDVTLDGPPMRLLGADGTPLPDPLDDSEGLAQAADGSLFISFELVNRIDRYGTDARLAEHLPSPPAFDAFVYNAGPEALAISADGVLYTMPEGDAAGARTLPVYRFADGVWDQPYTLPEDGTWRPVGADFGPDGWLYLLERDFWPLLGFQTRVRRFSFAETGEVRQEVLFTSTAGRFGNLEGIAIWQDQARALHATLISDNNFLAIQDSGFVDLAIRD